MSKAVVLQVHWGRDVDPKLFKNVPEGEDVFPFSLGQTNDLLAGFTELFVGDSFEQIVDQIENRLFEFDLYVHFEPTVKFMRGSNFECYKTNATIYTGKGDFSDE